MDLNALVEIFKNAAISPNKGDKVTAEILDVSESDGVVKYIVKFDDSLNNETRTLHFMVED